MAVPQSASASVGGGNVSVGWSIPGTPSSGLSNITFPLTVEKATAHQSGLYFAQQFNFGNAMGYTGLQPRENEGGHERLSARFSTFTGGSTTTDPNCHEGADGGPGVTCAVDFDAVYGHRYDLTVARSGTDTWTGTARDTVTGTRTHLGTWTLPAGSGDLQGSQGGFVEYYLAVPSCATMPRTDVVFGGPTSTDAGGLKGSAKANYEYSDCVGEANYAAEPVGTGTHITRGAVAAVAATASGTPATPPAESARSAVTPQTGSTPASGEELAETGGGDLPLAGAGAAVIAGGAGLLWLNRRRGRRRADA
ncbi:hypothetical protein ABZ930_01290 [Streptomyces sp. NPDC046716]|uniref:DUF3472 domain-containing protein n=1 Tax=Streptomyces sp. NPDC046716 TaxID=3157093 RepID=UPI0033CC821D